MQRLTQTLAGRGGDHGRSPLPDVLPVLAHNGMRLYRAQTTMIVGQPSSGKSLIALFYAVKLAEAGVRVLYVSADTDPDTMMLRAAAITSQYTVKECLEAVEVGAEHILDDAMAPFDRNLVFAWESSPSLHDIELECLAADEAWGSMPEVIIIDNLLNMATSSDQEYTELRQACAAFHGLSRKTGAAVCVLHHVSENRSKPDMPAPLAAVHGKVSQFPEAVWSVAMLNDQDIYRICAVKNRHDRHDKKGENFIELYVDAPRMSLYETRAQLQQARTRAEYR